MINKKQIEDEGKAQYAKWRQERNKLDMLRVDGTTKSAHGWMGPITNKVTGETMTEFSIQPNELNNKLIPLINPYMSKKETDWLSNQDPKNLNYDSKEFNEIKKKAINHAKDMDKANIDVFYKD